MVLFRPRAAAPNRCFERKSITPTLGASLCAGQQISDTPYLGYGVTRTLIGMSGRILLTGPPCQEWKA